MKKLDEKEIIRIMREEWDAKVAALSEAVDVAFKAKVDGKDVPVFNDAVGLKLRNKVKGGKKDDKGFLYTVVSVSPRDAILRTPEGEEFIVDKETLEKDYVLD